MTPVEIIANGLPLLFVEISGVFWMAIQNNGSIGVTGLVAIFKSTDGGNTWSQIDGAHNLTGSVGWNGSPVPAVYDGAHTFTFAYVKTSDGTINLQSFDLNAGTWGAVFGNENLSPLVPILATMFRQSTGNLVLFFQDESGDPGSIYAQIWNGSSWGAATKISGTAEAIINPATQGFGAYATGVIDSSDVVHLTFFAQDSGPPFQMAGAFYQEITASLGLQNAQTFPGNTGATPDLSIDIPGPLPSMFIQGTSIYWAIVRNNSGAGNPTYPSVYVGTPVINPVWTELGNLDPSNPGGGASNPGLIFDPITSELCLLYLSGPCRIITTTNGFASSVAAVFYDDTAGPTLFVLDSPLLIFGASFTYMASGSANTEGPSIAAFFTPLSPLPSPLDADCNNPPSGIVGIPYTHTFDASGGTPPYTFSISSGSLPPGLSLDDSTGIVSGTPTTAGNYPFALTVTDSASGTVTVNCSITIVAALGSVKITLRGVKLRCKPQDDPNFQQVPQLPGVKRAM